MACQHLLSLLMVLWMTSPAVCPEVHNYLINAVQQLLHWRCHSQERRGGKEGRGVLVLPAHISYGQNTVLIHLVQYRHSDFLAALQIMDFIIYVLGKLGPKYPNWQMYLVTQLMNHWKHSLGGQRVDAPLTQRPRPHANTVNWAENIDWWSQFYSHKREICVQTESVIQTCALYKVT